MHFWKSGVAPRTWVLSEMIHLATHHETREHMSDTKTIAGSVIAITKDYVLFTLEKTEKSGARFGKLETALAKIPAKPRDALVFKGTLRETTLLPPEEGKNLLLTQKRLQKAEDDLLRSPDHLFTKGAEEKLTVAEKEVLLDVFGLEEGTMPLFRIIPSFKGIADCYEVFRKTDRPMFYRMHFVQALARHCEGDPRRVTDLLNAKAGLFEGGEEIFTSTANKILRAPIPKREETTFFKNWRRETRRGVRLLGINATEIRKSGLRDHELPDALLSAPERVGGLTEEYLKKLQRTLGATGLSEEEFDLRKAQSAAIKYVESYCERENELAVEFRMLPRRHFDACVSLLDAGGAFVPVEAAGKQLVVPRRHYRESAELAGLLRKIRSESYWVAPKPRFERPDLDDVQKDAVRRALGENLFVVVGVAGAGKTTLIREMVSNLRRWGRKWTLIANNGVASGRIKSVVGTNNASTVASLVNGLHDRDRIKRFKELQHIVIDEASTLATTDFLTLLRKMRAFGVRAKVTLLGDTNQLEAVGRGLFFEQIVRHRLLPMARLENVYRTEDEAIYTNCTTIARGEGELVYNDTFHLDEGGLKAMYGLITAMKAGGVDLSDFIIICPWRGKAGSPSSLETINDNVRHIYGLGPSEAQKDTRGGTWHVGDKVRQTTNDDPRGCYNGDMGIVTSFARGKMFVTFPRAGLLEYAFEHKAARVSRARDGDGEYARATRSLTDLALAYGITIHSCQGGQWKHVIVFIPQWAKAQADFLNKRMMYTAISRAMERVFIFSDRRTAEKAAFLAPRDRPDPLPALMPAVGN